jgi:hypothetical protein
MGHDSEGSPERIRLARTGDEYDTCQAARSSAARYRAGGVRRARRASNWTAAVLVAGVAAASGYFAHAATAPVAATATQPGTAVSGTGHKATVTHPVVTSGGSGVVVGRAGQAPAYRDN